MGSAAAAIVKRSQSSFAYSFSFLPQEQKEALRTVYAFCRTTDDIVDNADDATKRLERLNAWRRELENSLTGTSQYPLLNQLHAIALKFNIPVDHFYELLKGVEMDLRKNRYRTFEELKEYCYLVASSVGLMSLDIFGPRNLATKEYAINLGIALQLTNIIRDVGLDAKHGRIYIPLEDMSRFNYTEEALFASRYDQAFLSLMEFEAARAEEYFRRAQRALPREDRKVMFAAKIMERIYFHTLLRIRKKHFNVFDQSVRLPSGLQFLIALKYWMKERVFGL
ncbi:MAG TPA: presqualene diphosphate synthase HpnD [Bacteroidota bacterium]|nr:presqualene diphosphate synthase HpnD [Bacteroidota bacterium]